MLAMPDGLLTPLVLSEFCRVEDSVWLVPGSVTAGTKMDVVGSTLLSTTLNIVVSSCVDNLWAVVPLLPCRKLLTLAYVAKNERETALPPLSTRTEFVAPLASSPVLGANSAL